MQHHLFHAAAHPTARTASTACHGMWNSSISFFSVNRLNVTRFPLPWNVCPSPRPLLFLVSLQTVISLPLPFANILGNGPDPP